VYQCRRGTDVIQVVVAQQLQQSEHNALLHLFSAARKQVSDAARQYRQRSKDTSSLLRELLQSYEGEGIAMPYTMEDFRRDYVKEHLQKLSPEERLEGLSPEELENYLRQLKASSASSADKKQGRRKGRKGPKR
jgi:hypothetical protein